MSTEPQPTRAAETNLTPELLDQLLPVVYDELRELAERTLGEKARSLTLQPTALVHEAFLKLGDERNGWSSRANFVIAASVAMRRVMLDHVRARNAQKRGGGRRADVDVVTVAVDDRAVDVLVLEEAMKQLEQHDPDAAQVAQLRVYAGLTMQEIAAATDVSEKTVQRRWRFARAWLIAAIGDGQ
ncbi:MAG: ECF-type sigma factor [Phycisphaerales bacterium]